jgi:DNA-binding SARP family transcriptional activator
MNGNVHLNLIGGFRLLVRGDPVALTGTGQRLVAYLALSGPAARAVTAGTLWPAVPEARALASLRTTIWRCNRAVDGLVVAEWHGIALASTVEVDVAGVLGGSSVPACSDLLPGWYDDWVVFERDRLRQRTLLAWERTAADLTGQGRFAASLDLALAAVRADPYRESARRAVIAVHLAQHNVAEAVREYHRFRAFLVDELGVEPSEDLAALVFRGGAPVAVTRR